MTIRPWLLNTLVALTSVAAVVTAVENPGLTWVALVWAAVVIGEIVRRRRRARKL